MQNEVLVSKAVATAGDLLNKFFEQELGFKPGWILMVWAEGKATFATTDHDPVKVAKALHEAAEKMEKGLLGVAAHQRN